MPKGHKKQVTSRKETKPMILNWKYFTSFVEASDWCGNSSCVYMQVNLNHEILRVGKATKGLKIRYNTGYAPALEACIYYSGGTIYITKIKGKAKQIEKILIWDIQPILNDKEKKTEPRNRINIKHKNFVIDIKTKRVYYKKGYHSHEERKKGNN